MESLSRSDTSCPLLHRVVTGMASTDLFISAIPLSGLFIAGGSGAVYLQTSSVLQIPGAAPSRGGGERWLRGCGGFPRRTLPLSRTAAVSRPELCWSLSAPTVPAAGRGSARGSRRGSSVLCFLPAAPSGTPNARGRVGEKQSPEPPSCVTHRANVGGKSRLLRAGHQGLPWVMAWLKGEA